METTLKETLIKKFNLTSFPPEEQLQILNEMGQVVMESTLRRTIPALPDEDGAEIDVILNREDSDISEAFAFLRSKIPDFQTIVDEEIESLHATLTVNG